MNTLPFGRLHKGWQNAGGSLGSDFGIDILTKLSFLDIVSHGQKTPHRI
jgi:hypothetical protein